MDKAEIKTACMIILEYAKKELDCAGWWNCRDCPVCRGQLIDALNDLKESL